MRKLLIATALVLALLGVVGAGSARALSATHAVAAHSQQTADVTPQTLCGGSSSAFCY